MVATAIAYFLSALFFLIGCYGFYQVGSDVIEASKEPASIIVSFAFIAAAWGCAYLGGI